jgi:hypothetical protein
VRDLVALCRCVLLVGWFSVFRQKRGMLALWKCFVIVVFVNKKVKSARRVSAFGVVSLVREFL